MIIYMMNICRIYFALVSVFAMAPVVIYMFLRRDIYILTYKSDTERQPSTTKPPPQEYPEEIHVNNTSSRNDTRMNVLFIIADDLRPQLGCYGGQYFPNPHSNFRMITPHLDGLSEKSLLLTRAYVQFSLCAPSRTSFLTGRRPDTTKVWDLVTYWRESGGNFTTLPQYFKNSGYTTIGTGKTFHGGTSARHFDIPSWSLKYKRPKHAGAWNLNRVKDTWRAATAAERQDDPLPDEEITQQAIDHMRNLADDARSGQKNFFLAVGFHKPHLPWVFPEEFLDLYPMDDMDIPRNRFLPWMMPESAYTSIHEFPLFNDIKKLRFSGEPNKTYPVELTKTLRRAYFACTSYIDSLVGTLLRELGNLGLAQNTIVTFLGDHGFHLGENNHWGKHSNFEQGAHAPLMIHIPGRTDRGMVSSSLVEFVDIYPTIVEAAGLGTIPSCPRISRDIEVCTEGQSFLPLIDQPEMHLKDAAYSQMPRDESMGYSIRTDKYRYTEWVPLEMTTSQDSLYSYIISWKDILGAELYDHEDDPEEQYNRVKDGGYTTIGKLLSTKLRSFVGNSIENATTKLP